ncbi:MAG: Sip1-related alpha-galactosidase [bacterium]|nr:Sip1-related alpha-galactosidase [bacterium]
MTWVIDQKSLKFGNISLIESLDTTVFTSITDPTNTGVFLHIKLDAPVFRLTLPIGNFIGERFSGLHRYEPFWVKPQVTDKAGSVNPETQVLMVQLPDKQVALIVPLIAPNARFCVQGGGDNRLDLVIDTGDPETLFTEGVALYIAISDDPYTLMPNAARVVMNHLKTGRLRTEKPLPAFIDQFGWCTWDAFYREVSHEKVREGLQSFVDGGVTPKFLILDDGWQSVEENRLTAFPANEKFPDGIGGTVQMAKGEFGLSTVFVWHALLGYWRGVHPEKMNAYQLALVKDDFHEGILHYIPNMNEWEGGDLYRPTADSIHNFYHDYHRYLRLQGVDGVKVDNQSRLDGLSAGGGGRVALMHRYHEALEGSTNVHFNGNLINCMSCANEMIYGALGSNIIRSSIDFWPDRPATHGEHLYTNAMFGMWFGEFLHPDWDMFQSAHPVGGFHAAGRAVSGSPIYVSDKPDAHNFDLLKKLVLADGRVLRPIDIGRPTPDCLFHDPTQEDVLLKIYNRNAIGAVLGVFNAKHEGDAIKGHVSLADIPNMPDDLSLVYTYSTGDMQFLAEDGALDVSLAPLGYDILTIIPIKQGIAPIGLVEMFNSAGAITAYHWHKNSCRLDVRGQGKFVIYAQNAPSDMTYNGNPLVYGYDKNTMLITFDLAGDGVIELTV